MDVLKDFNFWAIIAILVPGLLVVQTRALAARTELEPITKDSLVAYAIITVFYGLILWGFGYALQTGNSISSLEPAALFRLFVFIPAGVGFALGLLERLGFIRRLLLPLGINTPLPIKAVWLEIFAKQRAGTLLIVTLKDGVTFNAMITDDSRFSSNAESPDLYLGQLYSLTDWRPANPRRGLFVSGSEIRTIEIINPT